LPGFKFETASDLIIASKNLAAVRKYYEATQDWAGYKGITAGTDPEARFRARFNQIYSSAGPNERIIAINAMARSPESVKQAFDAGANIYNAERSLRSVLLDVERGIPEAQGHYGFSPKGTDYQFLSAEILSRTSSIKLKTGEFPDLQPARVSVQLGNVVCNFEGSDEVASTKDAIGKNQAYLMNQLSLSVDSAERDPLTIGYSKGAASDPQQFAAWYARHLEAASYSDSKTFDVARFERGLAPEMYQVDLLVGALSPDARTRGAYGVFEYLLTYGSDVTVCLDIAKQIRQIFEFNNLLGNANQEARESYFRDTIAPLFASGLNADALKSLVK
jgi:hypothetical protein